MHGHVKWRNNPARRQREDVERVAVGRLGGEERAQPGLTVGTEDGRDRAAEEGLRRVAEQSFAVLACLKDD